MVEARAHGLAHAGSPELAYVSRGAATARLSQRMCNLGSCWVNLDPATALFARSLYGGRCGRGWYERGWCGRSRHARAPGTRERPARRSTRTRERPARRSTRTRNRPVRGRSRRAGGAGMLGQVDERAQTAILGPRKATRRPSRHVLLGGTAQHAPAGRHAIASWTYRRSNCSAAARARGRARYTIDLHNPHTAKGHPCQKRLSPRTPACS